MISFHLINFFLSIYLSGSNWTILLTARARNGTRLIYTSAFTSYLSFHTFVTFICAQVLVHKWNSSRYFCLSCLSGILLFIFVALHHKQFSSFISLLHILFLSSHTFPCLLKWWCAKYMLNSTPTHVCSWSYPLNYRDLSKTNNLPIAPHLYVFYRRTTMSLYVAP